MVLMGRNVVRNRDNGSERLNLLNYLIRNKACRKQLKYCVTQRLTAASVSRVCTWYWCNAILILSDSQSHIFVIMDVYQS